MNVNVVGLLTPRTDWYGPTNSMIAIEVAAREAGYFVSLASVSKSSAESLRTAVGHFKDQAAEAVVLIAPEREWIAAARVVATDLPVVTMCADFRSTQPKLASVSSNNEFGGKLVTEVPALTTVRQEFPVLAAECLDELDRMLRSEAGRNGRIRPRMVVRSSTSAPSTARPSRPRVRRASPVR